MTGESVPVAKAAGDPVYASTLNAEGFLEIEATTDAGDTTLDRIARLVREAQAPPLAHRAVREAFRPLVHPRRHRPRRGRDAPCRRSSGSGPGSPGSCAG